MGWSWGVLDETAGICRNYRKVRINLVNIYVQSIWTMFYKISCRCHQVLSQKGIDLLNTINNKNIKTFDDPTNATVGVAIQLALIDLLKTIDINPDGYLGVSTGEIACAYADNCLDLQQAILTSYFICSSMTTKKLQNGLLDDLKKIIPTPKQRSSKWISGVKEKLCSPEYLLQSISSSFVLPEKLPLDSVIIELSPKASVPNSVTLLGGVEGFLEGVGQLYLLGRNPRIERVYPGVEFPVSRGTPMLAPMIKWNHSIDWYVTKFEINERIKTGERTVTVVLTDEEVYLAGHVIDGRDLTMPIAWKIMACFFQEGFSILRLGISS